MHIRPANKASRIASLDDQPRNRYDWWRRTVPGITFAEVLVQPLQTGNTVAEAGNRAFFVPSAHFEILPVDQAISDQAASLRASHVFELPDALHIATEMVAICTHYLTGDAKWTKTGLQVIDAATL